jgi:hypothetical protein
MMVKFASSPSERPAEHPRMAALLRTPPPPGDEIAERLRRETTARVKESQKLLAASKRTLNRKKG